MSKLYRVVGAAIFSALWCMSIGVSVGCGPSSRADDTGGDADAAPVIDAGPTVDARRPPPPIVFVHSRDTLYTFDADSLALVQIGSFGLGTEYMTDCAVTPEGVLYGVSKSKLYTIDTTTGAATLKATLGSGSIENVGLTFLRDGQLLATDKTGGVRRIDTSTGAVHELGSFGNGLTTAGDLVAIGNGTMYALSDKGPGGTDAFNNNWLLTVDTTTGVGTPVKQIGFGQVFGAAFINGKLLAFTKGKQVIEIDPSDSLPGTLVKTSDVEFWGAGVTPLVPIN